MYIASITALNKFFQRIAHSMSMIFSSHLNPLYYLGALTIYLLIIDSISGIYLFLFYSIDPKLSHESVNIISSQLIGNIMRGIHRYSSDALMITAIGHMIHVIITDRFRMFRWIAWVSGVLTILLFLFIGISGYVLVWDERAQLTSLLTAKFLSFVPVFGHAIMGTILGTDIKNLGGLFRVLLFAHIALTFFIVFVLWIHVMRISRPKLIPPKYLWITITLSLVIFSIFFPPKSDAEASLSKIPFGMSMDWFYLFGYPLLKIIPASYDWAIFIGSFLLLFTLPWLIKGKRNPYANINKDKCVGCEQCYIDCPYRAIIMQHVDDKKKAMLFENKCSGCATCVGSCPVLAIDIPSFNIDSILKTIEEKQPEVVAVRCSFSATPPSKEGVLTFTVPCVSALNPRYAESMLEKGAKGVLMVACEERDCHFREGNIWTDERYEGKRIPKLKKNTDTSRIRILQAPHYKDISKEIEEFRSDLASKKVYEKVLIKFPSKAHYLIASVILFVPLVIFYPLTTHRMSYYPQDKSVLVMSFKYRSSAIRKTNSTAPGAMKFKTDRSPIKIDVIIDGSHAYTKIYQPRGLRGDAAIYVYDEVLLSPKSTNITIKLSELAIKDKQIELSTTKELKAKDTLFITYDDIHKQFMTL
ncbi:MAG: hydrogenase iron-sulfur subunit [Nitrospirae bacterium]|nr:hydrogenase iron-sulfur subunit [Nitrospirota bacterium]